MLKNIDVAGYTGKEIELWVKPSNASAPNVADTDLVQIRGAQNFNPTEEKSETKVSEMGYEAQKVIYGTSGYSIACTLLMRDLVQIARLSGINTATAKRLSLEDFAPVNAVAYFRDPDTKEIVLTTVASGFKPRTASKTYAVEANATVVLDGSANSVVHVDGKANIREHLGDGSCTLFAIAADVTDDEVFCVEYPSGALLDDYDGYTFVASGIDGVPSIEFTTAPEDKLKVRIIYKI